MQPKWHLGWVPKLCGGILSRAIRQGSIIRVGLRSLVAGAQETRAKAADGTHAGMFGMIDMDQCFPTMVGQ